MLKFMSQPLAETDPEVAGIIRREEERQQNTLELIASENHVSVAVRTAVGSVFTNKYAEGYPGKRYYGGCTNMDSVEDLARERAKKLFHAEHVNVQPHSGAQANTAVFMACLKPGDTVLSLDLAHGGHLTHGLKVNFSGTMYNIVPYVVSPKTEMLDMAELRRLALEHKPKLIIAGASAYPRRLDFPAFAEIAKECGARLMADIAHIAGLIATGLHPTSIGFADFTTTTTHKTLRGPRGGMIMCGAADAALVDKWVFPGTQGGPLMHVIAGKATAFGEALRPEFKEYQQQILSNAQALAEALRARGYRLVSGGTDTHLMLVDLRDVHPDLTGKQAQDWLEEAGIITNKNMIPYDQRKPTQTSGLRLGTPALTTRGLKEPQMAVVAELVHQVLLAKGDQAAMQRIRGQVRDLCTQFPVPHA
ncbi:MAG TPA: serine hydroxymethyltransferase [Phycisphaerae bacterium]|jgi:glycine hydroxymethyltransferase|nr:serine hydroxymethyltransferase [Phycisphaerae bacterium]HPC21823.1 serine hydroxymethyltransferase [Phycisphaerae bacterium]HRS28141.1 serine hydroxymethyltransferase [Phycisphaerae bacterium]HRT41263.1 serine hydroxymethyltransferase [Phycisphaerae bacterium]